MPNAEPVETSNVAARLWVERTGTRIYTGHNTRGAEVVMGPADAGAVFTPGELLKLALAGCTGMSSDHALAHRLGDDVEVTVEVEGATHPTEDRYPQLNERLVVDLSGLDDLAKDRLLRVIRRAVDDHCTVGRTIRASATIDLAVTGE